MNLNVIIPLDGLYWAGCCWISAGVDWGRAAGCCWISAGVDWGRASLGSGLHWVSAEVPAAKRDGRPRRAREGG